PDLKYDDYESIDARGKVVAILIGAPDTFPNSERAHYSNSFMKESNAVAHGAAGILTFSTPDEEERSPWEHSIRRSRMTYFRWMNDQGEPSQYFLQLKSSAALSRAGAEKMFAGSKTTLNDVFAMHTNKKMRSFPLNVKVRMTKQSSLSDATSSNVAA